VDGTIKGNLDCTAKVIIGPTGYVEGQINCTNAIIEGRFEGVLNVKELLNVRNSAKINGEITTNKLIVEAGAVFNVTCKMGKQEPHARAITTEKKVGKIAKEAS
jgi:cytoskeletal protein CcmA (bactofilin family)